MSGSTVDRPHPARASSSLRAAAPRPLQRLQRPRRARRRPSSSASTPQRIAGRAGRRCAPPSAGSRRSTVGGTPVSILLIKNPAGANEVLRTLRLEAGERGARPLDRAQRPDRRRPRRLLGLGRRLRAARRRGAPRHLRRHAGAGDGAAAEVRRLAGGRGSRSSRRSSASLDRAVAAAPGAPLRPPHLHRPAGAAQAALRPRPGQGVLAMSATTARRRSGTTSSAAPTSADLALWEELAGAGRRPGPRPRLRHRPGRPRTSPGAATRCIGARPRPGAGRGPRRARGGAGCRPRRSSATPATSTSTSEFALVLAPMQLCSCSPAPASALACLRCVAAHLRPGGRVAVAIVERMPGRAPTTARLRSPTCARSTAGSTPACRSTPALDAGAIVVRRLRQTVSPDGELERGARTRSGSAPAARRDSSRPRRARPGSSRPAAARSRRPTSTSAPPSSCSEGAADGAARPRPLPRADEHLRRPRQHRLPAAALRVARASASPTPAPGPATRSTPPPTTSSTSAAARTATSARSPPTWSRPSARRSPRPSTTAPSCSPSAAATSCSATATSSARRSCPASASPTSRPCASPARG